MNYDVPYQSLAKISSYFDEKRSQSIQRIVEFLQTDVHFPSAGERTYFHQYLNTVNWCIVGIRVFKTNAE
jgi:hypothetical protein